MLYYVQPGDSLYKIAKLLDVTVQDILQANLICDPNQILVGEPIIIPNFELEANQKIGAGPYYVVLPGDTLLCLSEQLNTSVETLIEANQIQNPNFLFPGTELLVDYGIPNPRELQEYWKNIGNEYCEEIYPQMEHEVYYIGSFQWEALGRKAVPYLLDLLKHQCSTVRYFTVISLGRLALNQNNVIQALTEVSMNDTEPNITKVAKLALLRIDLVKNFERRIHLTTYSNAIHSEPSLGSPSITIPEGTIIEVLRWHIPNPSGEGWGGVQRFDYVTATIADSDITGYLPRFDYVNIALI